MTNYIITTKNMDMLEEAVKYVKTLLDAVDVRYIDYAIKFRESGYCIMHRINIKYHSPNSKKKSHDAVDLLASNLDQIRKGLEEFSYLGKK